MILSKLDMVKTEFLLRKSPKWHFENCVKIFNRANKLISPTCNILQSEMSRVYEECMERKIPCRMMVLKPRQVGCSTFASEIIYHHCRNYRTRAVQIADDLSHADNIFQILCHHLQHDSFPWSGDAAITNAKVHLENGSLIEKDTAQNARAGISATRQAIHASEVAKWAVGGAYPSEKVMGAMLNSLSDEPYTVAIAESTPHGTSGWFYENWKKAVFLEDFLRGKTGNGWIKVFAPWFQFEEYALQNADQNFILQSLDEREKRGVRLYRWNFEKIAWRRKVRDEKCSGNERIFDEYYPEDDVTCFIVSGSPRFDLEALSNLENISKQSVSENGVLHEGKGVVFEPTSLQDAWVQIWERPLEGMKYLIAADLALGVGQACCENMDTDCHSVLVLRDAYWDESSVEHPAMLAARIKPPSRVEFDLLAWQTDLLSQFYGRCPVVPEMNNSGMAFIERLKERGTPLYRRQKIQANGKVSHFDGWQTTSMSRKVIIDRLASAIRDGVDVRCPHVVGELLTFVSDSSGKEQAMSGCHDDDVLALAIGLYCLSAAIPYRRLDKIKHEPSDGYEKSSSLKKEKHKW